MMRLQPPIFRPAIAGAIATLTGGFRPPSGF